MYVIFNDNSCGALWSRSLNIRQVSGGRKGSRVRIPSAPLISPTPTFFWSFKKEDVLLINGSRIGPGSDCYQEDTNK